MAQDLKALLSLSGGAVSGLHVGEQIEEGLSAGVIDRIKKALGIPDRQLSATLGLSARTMTRLRKSKRRLPLPVGDRLYRLARTFTLAVDVLEDPTRAKEWLHTPQVGLNNRIPLDVLATEAGAREVEDLLRRIDLGVLA
jgi:putative toxin-antitoxin system antitoxin component (TIGR02293 family)